MGTDPQIKTAEHAIILFDGVCNLCNGAVQFIIKRDPVGYFKFASLQSSEATEILLKYDVYSFELESIILLEKSRLYRKSNAILRICRRLSAIWPVFTVFRIVPVSIRDLVYDWIANHRYRWFGKRDKCMIPGPELNSRFIEAG